MGEILVLLEEFEFNGLFYRPGHRFKVIGSDDIRGLDIEDENGNKIYETRFISNKFKSLKNIRKEKLKNLGII